MADEGDAMIDAIRTQRNRALDSVAILEGRCAKLRSENAKLTDRVAALEAELAAAKPASSPSEKNLAGSRRKPK